MIKAVDYIEENLYEEVDVGEVSKKAWLSPYHFQRIFKGITGEPLMEYVRKRRLTEASLKLLNTKKRIIEIAVETGFESQEVFTRAFKRLFEVTPGTYRKNMRRGVLVERSKLTADILRYLKGGQSVREASIVSQEDLKIVGLEMDVTFMTNRLDGYIASLWEKFIVEKIGEVKNIKNGISTYGILEKREIQISESISENDIPVKIIVGIEVTDFSYVPDGMISRIVKRENCAAFIHKGEINKIDYTHDYIYGNWFPNSGYEVDNNQYYEMIECKIDNTGVDNPEAKWEIFIPIKNRE